MEHYQSLHVELADKKAELTHMETHTIPGRWRLGLEVYRLEQTLGELYAAAEKQAPKKMDLVCCSECDGRLLVSASFIHPYDEPYALSPFLGQRVCNFCYLEVNNELLDEYHDDETPEPDGDPYEDYDYEDDRPVPSCEGWDFHDCGTQTSETPLDTYRWEVEW